MNGAGDDAPSAMVAIETATETVGVAVRTAAGVQAELTLTGRRRHVETLTPALEHLLAQLDARPVRPRRGGGRHRPRALHGPARRCRRGQGTGPVAGHRGRRGDQPGHPDGGCRRGRAARPGPGLCRRPAGRGVRRRPRGGRGRSRPVRAPADRPVRARKTSWRRWTSSPASRSTPWGMARCATPTCCGPSPGPTRTRRASPSRPRPPCSNLVRARLDAGEPPVGPASVVPLYMREADAKSNFDRAVRA